MENNSIITITDAIGRIEYANENYCKILKCEAKQLIGETHQLIRSHLHSGLLYKNLWRTITSGRKWHGILNDKALNGEMFWLDTIIIPIKTEKSFKYLSIYHDVTQLRRENIQLFKRNIAQKDFLTNMDSQSLMVSRFGKILNANKKFGEIEVDELIGTYVYDYICASWFEIFRKNIDFVFKNKVINKFETTDYDSNGQTIVYTNLISPVFDALGLIDSVMISMYKIAKPILKNEEFKNIESNQKAF